MTRKFPRPEALYLLILLLEAFISHESSHGTVLGNDLSESPTILESTTLPVDENGKLVRFNPTVGNGHIATTIFTDRVFMNGLFNGFKGESHRAIIPSMNNIRIILDDTQASNVTDHLYMLDIERGMFVEKFKVDGHSIEHRIFAHRYYHKVIINQFQITHSIPDKNSKPLELKLSPLIEEKSVDIDFEAAIQFESDVSAKSACGKTFQVEDPRYQAAPLTICLIYSELPEKLVVKSSMTVTHFAAYDKLLRGAASDFNAVAALVNSGNHEQVYESHVQKWKLLWDQGRIEIDGNLELAKVVNSCFYYIVSSLPVTENTNSAVSQFYGLSPSSLASGSILENLQGHSFWDTEIWIFPVVTYFFPEAAREILNYRLFQVKGAKDRAEESGYPGVRFPWEGGVTGNDITPECCPQNKDLQVHITADVAFAIRQYISITGDIEWLRETQPNHVTNVCGLIRGIAEFWISRASYNRTTRFYDINDVVCPDDSHAHVNNNGFTNVIAAYAIFFAKYAECLCDGSMEPIPDNWVQIAKSFKVVYDSELDYHPQFEGYVIGDIIKQADAVLLGFPLMYPMSPETRKNDLNIYEKVTRQTGPAMTWAIHTIGILELDEIDRAEAVFNKSYQSYLREPFKVWTDNPPPGIGTVNFITGMGGFLQAIVSGYGGYRLYYDKIVFSKPRLPPGSNSMKLIGLNFLDNSFDVLITSTTVKIRLTFASSNYVLVVESENKTQSFESGRTEITLANGDPPISFTLRTRATGMNCSIPSNRINFPYEDNGSKTAAFHLYGSIVASISIALSLHRSQFEYY